MCTRAGCLCAGFLQPAENATRAEQLRYSKGVRTTAERKWSDPVKDKRPSPETLNVKGDLGKLRDVLRRVVRKPVSREAAPERAGSA